MDFRIPDELTALRQSFASFLEHEVRPVEPGQFYGDQWIITKGLKAGDPVVVDGAIKLAPGAPVKVTGPAK